MPERKHRPPRSSEDDAAVKWLEDAPVQSAHALSMLGAETPPTPPQNGTGFYRPNSVDDFVAAQQYALDNGRMLMLDPSTVLEFTTEVVFTPRGTRMATGLWAYGAKFLWKSDGDWTRKMITYRTDGQENQYLTISGLAIQADQTNGSQACPDRVITLEARSGAALRGFQLDDVTMEGGCHGIWCEGEVFEGYINRPRMSWVRHAGIVCRHQYDIPGVLSNVFISQPNITRVPINMGSAIGILCDRAPSVLIDQGNFISLDGPAIKGDAGVKRITNCDLENCGNINGVGIEIERSDFFSQVLNCEGANTNGDMKYLLWHGGTPESIDVANNRNMYGEVMAPADYFKSRSAPPASCETAEGLYARHEAQFREERRKAATFRPSRRRRSED